MNGLCVLDVPDAGGRDAGPPDPCELAGCGVGGELARPRCRAGICMACESPLDCVTSSAPVCDIALGACVARPTPARCEPCTFAEDCGASLVCVDRDAPLERVCLERCEDGETCPSGFECLGALCYPTIGASCTGMREARAGRTCTTDADCAPVAATYDSGLFQGSCFEEPAGSGSRCHHPCGLPSDCPAGLRCDPVREFCVSP